MKIGIIVYSYSGNTLSVAKRLKQSLESHNHLVFVDLVESSGNNMNAKELISIPNIEGYDLIIFASPVQAFSLAPVMKAYLNNIDSLSNKKVYCFVTEHFKKPWLGGNHANRQITKICKIKGSEIIKSYVINWSSINKEKQIEDLIKAFLEI